LGNGALEKLALVVPAILVLSVELLNSAIEAVVDKVSPEFHELAGRAKDMGSAAVFLLLLTVILSWALILGPRWLG
jgi:diacylglycerol kinase (ATP)